MTTRTLTQTKANSKVYTVRNDSNQIIGTDEEFNLTTQQVNEQDIRNKAQTALTNNATFLALASPTNADVLAQVKLLTRENTALIKLFLGLLDDTSGT